MARPNASFSQTIQDYGTPGSGTGAEKSTWGAFLPPITAANIVAVNAAVAALRIATDAIILGSEVHAETTSFIFNNATVNTDPLAERENKWLVRYHDTAGVKYSLEIPTAKLSLRSLGTEFLDLTLTDVATWVSAFEAIAVSPGDGSAVTVDSIQSVGRRA